MSDEGLPPPGSGTPPPPPPPPPTDPPSPSTPEEPPGAGGPGAAETPPAGIPAEPEPTTQMPPVGAAAAGAAVGGTVVGAGYPPGSEPPGYGAEVAGAPLPWYRQRGPLIAAIVGGFIFLAALIGLLVWYFAGDDDGPSTANTLVFMIEDEQGEPLQRDYLAAVAGPEEFPNSYNWLQPPNNLAPEPASGTADGSGKIEFQWAPTNDVPDPTRWFSQITVLEQIEPGWTAPGPIIGCTLERRDVADSIIQMTVDVSPADPTVQRQVTYSFVDHVFQPGDRVTCDLVEAVPGATTTTTTTTTSTVPETTTTTSTTTTTTEPPVTDPPVTDPPVTDPPVTDPPVTEVSLFEYLESEPDLSIIVSIIEQADLTDEFEDADSDIGFFAPHDDAFAGVTLPATQEEAEELVQTHMSEDGAIAADDFVTGDLAVLFGGPHALVVETDPSTLGGFPIIATDQPAAPGEPGAGTNGVVHVIAGVLPTS